MDDFFSTEAQLVLSGDCEYSAVFDTFIDQECFPQEETVGAMEGISADPGPSRKRKPTPSTVKNIPGYSVLYPRTSIIEKPMRARYDEDRRKEVEIVRKVGACLRCRLLKIPVRSSSVGAHSAGSAPEGDRASLASECKSQRLVGSSNTAGCIVSRLLAGM